MKKQIISRDQCVLTERVLDRAAALVASKGVPFPDDKRQTYLKLEAERLCIVLREQRLAQRIVLGSKNLSEVVHLDYGLILKLCDLMKRITLFIFNKTSRGRNAEIVSFLSTHLKAVYEAVKRWLKPKDALAFASLY